MELDLQKIRACLDQIDHQLLDLFARRMEVTGQVAAYKKEHQLPILDAAREEEILSRLSQQAGPDQEMNIRQLYQTIFQLSRAGQARRLFPLSEQRIQWTRAAQHREDILKQELFLAAPFSIMMPGVRPLPPIPANAALHFFEALPACLAFLREQNGFGILTETEDSTSLMALALKEGLSIARIWQGSLGQKPLALLSAKPVLLGKPDRTVLSLSLPQKPGALHALLSPISAMEINVDFISPLLTDNQEAAFLLGLSLSLTDEKALALLDDLSRLCLSFKVLGCYEEVSND